MRRRRELVAAVVPVTVRGDIAPPPARKPHVKELPVIPSNLIVLALLLIAAGVFGYGLHANRKYVYALGFFTLPATLFLIAAGVVPAVTS